MPPVIDASSALPQLYRSKPINSSGFKIALELLLKSPRPSTLPEVPYSFGIRTVGSSKLSSKIMLKYVGQLVSLYVWAWGFGFHFLVAVGITLAVRVAEKLWRSRRRALTRGQEYPLGGYHADAGVPPLSPKARATKGARSSAGSARALTSRPLPTTGAPGGGGTRGGVDPATGAGSSGLGDWVGNVVSAAGGQSSSQRDRERKRYV